ncbi:MAG: histidine kinase [Paracoccus sp. (in: a-proteobacteria)]|uniref:ATP-binding protein n=1 Tax=Paracoccus sp. TaxID=267 RepID=UPI0026DF4E6B|nr:ATP-binding protein [Paracoccus sp. (in: a-proteobacteria)]MDO5632002.1 histidine kinase [Paracoccus sp. (in: a-proteobacteria)]
MSGLRLQTRIVLLIVAVQALLLAGLAAASLDNARRAVRDEVQAGMDTARSLVLATVGTMQGAVPPDRLMALLPERLVAPRHARIMVLDAQTGALHNPLAPQAQPVQAPGWFAAAITPSAQETRLPVMIAGRLRGYVFISADPTAEVAEVWRDARIMAGLTALAALVQAVLIWLVLQHGLRPLGQIAARLADLTRGDLAARIGPVAVPDLAALAAQADRLGYTLQQAQADRTRLSRQVVTRGDEERKAIARDLHDEFGPCLFALRVEADALRQSFDDPAIHTHADTLDAIADQIGRVNRALLDGLRPMAVGQLPLATVLADYAADLTRRFPDMRFDLDLPPGLPEPDEATALTLFRIMQEGTTNALRHSGASQVSITLRRDPAQWQITIADDGHGIPDAARPGTGLSGMRERVILLGGALNIGRAKIGTEIRASLPAQGIA